MKLSKITNSALNNAIINSTIFNNYKNATNINNSDVAVHERNSREGKNTLYTSNHLVCMQISEAKDKLKTIILGTTYDNDFVPVN